MLYFQYFDIYQSIKTHCFKKLVKFKLKKQFNKLKIKALELK